MGALLRLTLAVLSGVAMAAGRWIEPALTAMTLGAVSAAVVREQKPVRRTRQRVEVAA